MRLALLFILLSCFILSFVFWFFLPYFVFPSLEFSVAGWRSVNLTLPFLDRGNGDFSILMRDILIMYLTDLMQEYRHILWIHASLLSLWLFSCVSLGLTPTSGTLVRTMMLDLHGT